MITQFGSLYAGHVDLENIGLEGTPVNERWLSDAHQATVFEKIRRFLDTRPERVAVVASSSWSHSFLAHKFQCCAIDLDTDRRYLELLRRGAGSQLAELTPEAIQASGDHEFLNWIIALGIIGDTPAEIVDVRESHTQLAFRVAAVWE
jgi:hypothetical protein